MLVASTLGSLADRLVEPKVWEAPKRPCDCWSGAGVDVPVRAGVDLPDAAFSLGDVTPEGARFGVAAPLGLAESDMAAASKNKGSECPSVPLRTARRWSGAPAPKGCYTWLVRKMRVC